MNRTCQVRPLPLKKVEDCFFKEAQHLYVSLYRSYSSEKNIPTVSLEGHNFKALGEDD